MTAVCPAAHGGSRPRTDAYGDPLPGGALARIGTARFRTGPYAIGVALSPDGRLLAVGDRSGISFLSTETGKEVRRIEGRHQIAFHGASSLWFTPDGKQLLVAGYLGLLVCDVARAELVYTFPERSTPGPPSISVSADGKLLALGADRFGGEVPVRIWDLEAKKELKKIAGAQNQMVRAVLAPDGKIVATFGQNGRGGGGGIQLWDVAAGKEVRALQASAYVAAFSPDGKRLAAIDPSSTLSLWEVSSGKRLDRFLGPHGVATVLAYSPDGKELVVGSMDGSVQVREAASGKLISRSRVPCLHLTSIAFRPDRTILAAGLSHQAVHLWEVSSGRELSPQSGPETAVSMLAFSRDGKALFSGGEDGVRMWETSTGKQVRRIDPPPSDERAILGPPSCQLSSNGRYLLWSHRHRGELRVVETSTGLEVGELGLAVGHEGPTVAFATDVNIVAGLGWELDGGARATTVRAWDLDSGRELQTFAASVGNRGNLLALSPNGKVLALAQSSFGPPESTETSLWDVASGKQLTRLVGNTLGAMTFSPDGAMLATAGIDGAVRLWSVADGKVARTLSGDAQQWCSALAFSPDGRKLAVATGARDGSSSKVLLWELASGKVRSELAGHRDGAQALAFSPDGRVLATGGHDTTILLWDLTGRSELSEKLDEKLPPAELARLWAELDSPDTAAAHRAMARLAAAPAEALGLFARELRPDTSKPLSDKEVRRLLADLDDDSYEVREKATDNLLKGGRGLRPVLVEALKAGPGPEKNRRLQEVLDGLAESALVPGLLRSLRVLEVLEWIDGPDACRMLEPVAGGNADAPLTTEAKASLRRLRK
jgi:WD40 repeat protein